VIGDFNDWSREAHPLRIRDDGSGIWEGFVAGLTQGARYKYHVVSGHRGQRADKGDPFAQRWEVPPATASLVCEPRYSWGDSDWMQARHGSNGPDAPWAIYEVHLGSWRRAPDEGQRFLSYRELAPLLADYALDMGYTHVELLPVMEHPFYGSWGYQITGYFAPTSRYGSPEDFMYFVDHLHRRGVGVILDWVPSHFPDDVHGLARFDGTHLFEHEDPKRGLHAEWDSFIFNYGRHEVRAFLISNAAFWIDRYHADALRVDGVASMLYLDYAREPGEWVPNEFGGREDLEAIDFMRKLNQRIYAEWPDVQTIAEESTDWPMVSRPVHLGGLGFGMKWNMGWMNDTLEYMSHDPVDRKHHHDRLTFSIWYAFSENFVLPLSHDEVVHGKASLIGKLPGDDWQKFANLRLLFGLLYGHPGKKLLFMGDDFGQWAEWDHDGSLHWDLLERPPHRGLRHWVRDLNHFYRQHPAMYELDFSPQGFEWIDRHGWQESVISFVRKARTGDEMVLVVCNFTPVPREAYTLGAPRGGYWREALNSDAEIYAGSGWGNFGGVAAAPVAAQGREFSLTLNLPPLATLFLTSEAGD
jgi:1,4-alpha-glucan branching enzyme